MRSVLVGGEALDGFGQRGDFRDVRARQGLGNVAGGQSMRPQPDAVKRLGERTGRSYGNPGGRGGAEQAADEPVPQRSQRADADEGCRDAQRRKHGKNVRGKKAADQS